MNGITLYVCFGKRGKTGLFKDGPSIRLTILWVSLCLMWLDLERAMGDVNKYVAELEAKVNPA